MLVPVGLMAGIRSARLVPTSARVGLISLFDITILVNSLVFYIVLLFN